MQLSRTPLHEAACVGNVEVVTTLLDSGADVGEKDVVRKSFVIDLYIYIYSCLQTFWALDIYQSVEGETANLDQILSCRLKKKDYRRD